MPTKVKAVYEGGVFRPLEPLDFTEKTPVELTIEPLPQRSVVDETHGLIHIDPATAKPGVFAKAASAASALPWSTTTA